MRRVAIAVTALLASSLVPFAAQAADSTVTVPWNHFPEGTDISWVGCTDLFTRASDPGPLLYISDVTPPLGQAFWGFQVQSADQAVGAFLSVDHLATTSVAAMKFDSVGAAEGVAYVLYTPAGTTDNTFWVGRAALSAADTGWQDVDVVALTYAWQKRDPGANGGAGGYIADGGSHTIATFLASNGLDGAANFTIGYGCNGNRVYFDAFKVGSPGNVTTYDLEREQSETTIAPSPGTITAGGQATLTGGTRPVGTTNNYANAQLHLEAKPAGASDFTDAGEASTGPDGQPATLQVKPTVTTEYRWRFDGAASIEASVSSVTKVQVRAAVTALVVDRTLSPGQTLVVTGKTTPAKPGYAATLWRKTATGKTKLATATIKADGSFRLTKRLKTKGVWKVFVTVPASTGNLAGTSLVRKATVR